MGLVQDFRFGHVSSLHYIFRLSESVVYECISGSGPPRTLTPPPAHPSHPHKHSAWQRQRTREDGPTHFQHCIPNLGACAKPSPAQFREINKSARELGRRVTHKKASKRRRNTHKFCALEQERERERELERRERENGGHPSGHGTVVQGSRETIRRTLPCLLPRSLVTLVPRESPS